MNKASPKTLTLNCLLIVILTQTKECLHTLSENITKVINKDIITDKHVGHLIPMKCGHRGKPNSIEERLLENVLRHSGFMELNEDLSSYQESESHRKGHVSRHEDEKEVSRHLPSRGEEKKH